MTDQTLFQSLSADEKSYALRIAADRSGYRLFVFEKDIRVVQILKILFDAPHLRRT